MEHPEIYQELEELYEKEKYYIMYEKQNQLDQMKVENNQQENVEISKAAMEKLQNNKTDEIRQDKVDEMRKKIANGEFQINANKIADKLLQQYKTTEALKHT